MRCDTVRCDVDAWKKSCLQADEGKSKDSLPTLKWLLLVVVVVMVAAVVAAVVVGE